MSKFKLHPSYIILGIIYFLIGKFGLFLACFFAVIIHEFGHSIIALAFGYKIKNITVMPYGGVASFENIWAKRDATFILISGVLFNLLSAFICVAVWWFFPATYAFTYDFVIVSFCLAVFNSLPFYPLDGAKLIVNFANKKYKVLTRLSICGKIAGIIFVAYSTLSAFFLFNLNIGILGIYLFLGSVAGIEMHKNEELFNKNPMYKNYEKGIQIMQICINTNACLQDFIKHLSPSHLLTFNIINDSGNLVKVLGEKDLIEYCIKYPLNSGINEIIAKQH